MLKYIDPPSCYDKNIILTAVSQDGSAFQYIRGPLRYDREVALAAVKTGGTALQYVGAFRDDKKVVLAAIRADIKVMRFVKKSLLCDAEIIRGMCDIQAIKTPIINKCRRLLLLNTHPVIIDDLLTIISI